MPKQWDESGRLIPRNKDGASTDQEKEREDAGAAAASPDEKEPLTGLDAIKQDVADRVHTLEEKYKTDVIGVNHDIEDIAKKYARLIPEGEREKYREMVIFLLDEMDMQKVRTARATGQGGGADKELTKAMHVLRRKFRCSPKKSALLQTYLTLVAEKVVERNDDFRQCLVAKATKSESGVLVITVLTSPYPEGANGKKQKFSCKWNCYYCPNEPGQPRSYLRDEPAVRRANQNEFDPVRQLVDRASSLAQMGHPVDKLEILVLGGTWASYPLEYRERFIRDLFYAANTFWDNWPRADKRREALTLSEEKALNESAATEIIGLTLETRPDCIDEEEIRRFRHYGCTRVQLGIQHTHDDVLEKVNRDHTFEDAARAFTLLKNSCYKIDIHLMPNLPGSTVAKDEAMFNQVLDDPELQADQWKIYPTEITPWTVIKTWYEKGEFVPYSEEELFPLLARVKAKVHPWIRLNRVIRDIPTQYLLGGAVVKPNLRQDILDMMKKEGKICRCIRCREVGDDEAAPRIAVRKVRTYRSSNGTEHFLSMETPDESKICGFLRLRFTDPGSAAPIFKALEDAALIRELHVYGQMIATSNKDDSSTQHIGFGRQLMNAAEELARRNGYRKIAVISGVGTRNYYRKLGYELDDDGEYMTKELPPWRSGMLLWAVLAVAVAIVAWWLLKMTS